MSVRFVVRSVAYIWVVNMVVEALVGLRRCARRHDPKPSCRDACVMHVGVCVCIVVVVCLAWLVCVFYEVCL